MCWLRGVKALRLLNGMVRFHTIPNFTFFYHTTPFCGMHACMRAGALALSYLSSIYVHPTPTLWDKALATITMCMCHGREQGEQGEQGQGAPDAAASSSSSSAPSAAKPGEAKSQEQAQAQAQEQDKPPSKSAKAPVPAVAALSITLAAGAAPATLPVAP